MKFSFILDSRRRFCSCAASFLGDDLWSELGRQLTGRVLSRVESILSSIDLIGRCSGDISHDGCLASAGWSALITLGYTLHLLL